MSRFKRGDRVVTPDGPGRYISPWRERDRYGEMIDSGIIVELDVVDAREYEGERPVRRVFRGDKVNPETKASP